MGMYGKYFVRYKIPFLTAVFCVICEAVCDLLGPTLMSHIINDGIENKDVGRVFHWGMIMLAVTAVGAVFAVTRNILSSKVSQRVGADLRKELFGKIVRFSEASADKIESGSLITRMTNDTTQITQFVNGIMRIFMKAPITCIGSIVLAAMLNWRLSLVVYGVVALVAVFILLSMKLSYPRYAVLQKAMDRVNSVVQEYLIGVRLVKAFGTYPEEEERFGEANTILMKRGVSSQMIVTLISPLMSLTVGLGTAAVIYMGAGMFESGTIGTGEISAFTIYMSQILSSLMMITNVFNTFVRTKASTVRIQEVLNSEDDFLPDGVGEKLDGSISFEHVTFSYPEGSGLPVLQDLSFAVEHGQSLAVIGPTGSGKSTIAWLLLRFYDPAEGRILLGGKDLHGLGVDTIRKNVTLVPQKPMLFSGSVQENLCYGFPEASRENMENAARIAQADFIERMPGRYSSMLGSAGVNLSGGQRQRLSIARGIVKDASVLVLDDATSALDAVTEANVRKGLKELAGERTVITVTQRCTTAMSADRILVLENGKTAGFGTHEELLRNCIIYQEIYQSQIGRVEGVKGGIANGRN